MKPEHFKEHGGCYLCTYFTIIGINRDNLWCKKHRFDLSFKMSLCGNCNDFERKNDDTPNNN